MNLIFNSKKWVSNYFVVKHGWKFCTSIERKKIFLRAFIFVLVIHVSRPKLIGCLKTKNLTYFVRNSGRDILRRFYKDKVYLVSTLIIGWSVDPKKDMFRLKDEDEDVLEFEVLYLSAIGSLLYMTQCTRPDITFAVNLLARHSSAPTQRNWTCIKTIFRYLKGTIDMCLFYPYRESR